MESISIRLPPQFLPGSDNVLTDSLSRPHQLPHPEWSIHMTVFLFLRRLWPVQIVSLQPRPLIVVRFTSPLSGIRGQQARTRFSSSGKAFRLTRSIRWLSSTYYREAPCLHGDGTHSCPPCVVTVQFYLRFSVFTFRPCLRIRCFGFCSAPSNSLQRSVCYVPILGTCLWCCLSSLTGL